jgi:predicted nuclease with TOPRIM domain
MSELDEKLKTIVKEPTTFIDDDTILNPAIETAVEQIKQAFIEAGWSEEPRQYDQYGNLKINGREWYDKFMEELGDYDFLDVDAEKVTLAAKKAAGIE